MENVITVKFVPDGVDVNSDIYNKYAVISQPCTRQIYALNNGLDISHQIDINKRTIADIPNINDWIGTKEAVNRMKGTCFQLPFGSKPLLLKNFVLNQCDLYRVGLMRYSYSSTYSSSVCFWSFSSTKASASRNGMYKSNNTIAMYLGFDKNEQKCCKSNGINLEYYSCHLTPPTPIPTPPNSCKAKVIAKGDDNVTLSVSKDAGNTFINIAENVPFYYTLNEMVSNITNETILRFTVDNWCLYGAFAATVQLIGIDGDTFNLYTNYPLTNFTSLTNITWGQSFNDKSIIYYSQNQINSESVPGMDSNASWVWPCIWYFDKNCTKNECYKTQRVIFDLNFANQQQLLYKMCLIDNQQNDESSPFDKEETNEIIMVILVSIGTFIIFISIMISIYFYRTKKQKEHREKLERSKTIFISNPMVIVIAIGIYDSLPKTSEIDGDEINDLCDLNVDIDIKNLYKIFNHHFGYKINPNYNLNEKQTLKLHWNENELVQFFENKAKELNECVINGVYDGLIVVISSHGIKHHIITSDWKKMEKIAIHRMFSVPYSSSRLIPRIFIYDCCDGQFEQTRSPSPTPTSFDDENNDDDNDKPKGYGLNEINLSTPTPWTRNDVNPDYRLCTIYAANPGFQAKMNNDNGSYLVYGLINKLMDNNHDNKFFGEILDELQHDLHSQGKQQIINVFNNNTRFIKFKINDNQNNNDKNNNNDIQSVPNESESQFLI